MAKSAFWDTRGPSGGSECPPSRTTPFLAWPSPCFGTSEGPHATPDVRHRGLHPSWHGQVRALGHPRALTQSRTSTIADYIPPGTTKSAFRDNRGPSRGSECPPSRTTSLPAWPSTRIGTSRGRERAERATRAGFAGLDVQHRGLHPSWHGQVRVPGQPWALTRSRTSGIADYTPPGMAKSAFRDSRGPSGGPGCPASRTTPLPTWPSPHSRTTRSAAQPTNRTGRQRITPGGPYPLLLSSPNSSGAPPLPTAQAR